MATTSLHCAATNPSPFRVPVPHVGLSTIGTPSDSTHAAVSGKTRRGVFVFLHPSHNSDYQLPLATNPPVWDPFGAFQSLKTALNTDGWVVVYPAYPMDWSVNGVGYFGNMYNDVVNDSAFGARFSATILEWWDHLCAYLQNKYGANVPIVVGGFSLGAWATLTIVKSTNNPPKGYIAHCPATLWPNIFATSYGTQFAAQNWSGMNLSATYLNTVTIPGIVGYSDNDDTVGWTNTTADANWQGLSVASVTLGATTTVTASSFPNVVAGMNVTFVSGTGSLQANTTVASVSGGNCVLNLAPATTGTATLKFGGPLSNTSQMVAAAIAASKPVTGYQVTTDTRNTNYNSGTMAYPNGHLMLTTDSSVYCAPSTGWMQTTIDPSYPIAF